VLIENHSGYLLFNNLPILSLEEECESSLCTSVLRARNLELSQDMKKMTAVFEKLQTYMTLLALPSKCFLAHDST
jgi:protein phosphatase 1 regulatory subunit 21